MNDSTDEAALAEENSQINAEVLQNISVTLSRAVPKSRSKT